MCMALRTFDMQLSMRLNRQANVSSQYAGEPRICSRADYNRSSGSTITSNQEVAKQLMLATCKLMLLRFFAS